MFQRAPFKLVVDEMRRFVRDSAAIATIFSAHTTEWCEDCGFPHPNGLTLEDGRCALLTKMKFQWNNTANQDPGECGDCGEVWGTGILLKYRAYELKVCVGCSLTRHIIHCRLATVKDLIMLHRKCHFCYGLVPLARFPLRNGIPVGVMCKSCSNYSSRLNRSKRMKARLGRFVSEALC